MKKLLTPLVLSLFLVIAALVSLPAAQPVQADFTVTQAAITGTTTVLPTSSYVFTASGFAANEQVGLYIQPAGGAAPGVRLNPVTGPEARVDGSGQLVYTVTLPSNLVFGSVTIRARNQDGTGDGTYAAAVTPVLALDATQGVAGSPLLVDGFGFSAGEAYTVTFTNGYSAALSSCVDPGASVQEVLGTGTTTVLGSLRVNSTVPSVPAGSYDVVAVGASSATCVKH